MAVIERVISSVNSILWSSVLIIGLVGIGLYFSIRLGFPQLTRFGPAAKKVFGGIFKKEQSSEGSMSSFQAVATAIAAQIGTGNVAGVATAITLGGPGAIFWMWVSAFLGMSTIFVEATLAQKYRERDTDGQLVGGPAYYIKNGLGSKGLASVFAIALIMALGFIGNMVQSNSIADAISRAFNIPQIAIGVVLAILSGLIFIGGIKRIASFAETVVPVMAAVYILGSLIILVKFSNQIGTVLYDIFVAAFNPNAVLGGAAGVGVAKAVRYGIARGLFSNEAGMGSTPNSHAVADVAHPAEQGLSAMIAVFIDTILVCTATAVAILATGAHELGLEGVAVTQKAFTIAYGPLGEKFLAACLTFFAFTTVVGWYYFGENNIRFLFKNKSSIRVYQAIVLVFIVLGSYQKVAFVWEVADMFNGIMVIPNLIGIFLLFKHSKGILEDYDTQLGKGQKLSWKYEYESANK
ncbi:sodium:alanine symporter family protein [Tissierella creatinini]|nr:sodium:alanine symporter family protein [Tissierella creatinini]TJX66519.1 sodium:alanine symporter family protein [Soehngenia saccharolytica]